MSHKSTIMPWAAAALALTILGACEPAGEDATPTQTPDPAICDAGDEAFVSKVMPVLWGRKPRGVAETRAWASMASEYGRDVMVRAMTQDPDYIDHWSDLFMDALGVARTGDRAYAACFGTPNISLHDGGLARFLMTTSASGANYETAFNMSDVLRSALVADNLSVPYRVNIFARMNRPVYGANVGPYELENNRRVAFGDEFYDQYLSRNLTCVPCHNSEYSVTDHDTPEMDRHWEIPGLFEKAIMGTSYGLDKETAYAIFRYIDLMRGDEANVNPWGLSPGCGTFSPPQSLQEDFLDNSSYFIEDYGQGGSVWQVESYLQQGVERLRAEGLSLLDGNEVAGPEAFAYMVATSIVNRVWEETTGSPLTIATAFPRNQMQRDILQDLTDAFVLDGFSLRSLLVNITQHPYFNAGAPENCTSLAYGMQPIYNPWSIAETVEERQMNGTGDQVSRHSARTLMRSVHDSLGWAQPSKFLARTDPLASLQTNLGAYMRTSQPGYNGTDFQGVLAFEDAYGACQPPQVGGAGDGCKETAGYGGCASCTCQDCVCGIEPYCCDVQWDAICVNLCNDDCGGCGGGLAAGDQDVVNLLLEGAKNKGATVGELVLALKDRLTSNAQISEEEQTLMQDLLKHNFDDPVNDEVEPSLRVLCGAILLSPEYFLTADMPREGDTPELTLNQDGNCQRMADLMATQGVTVSCGEVSQ